ncbi:MAG: hypothetical protein D6820_04580 [Lentisphaerae bacterium]|nr:MAG: hypothetical protein D6820_04580 [Lentisphaerota bacterium]
MTKSKREILPPKGDKPRDLFPSILMDFTDRGGGTFRVSGNDAAVLSSRSGKVEKRERLILFFIDQRSIEG